MNDTWRPDPSKEVDSRSMFRADAPKLLGARKKLKTQVTI
jgi:hypothetical protein